jgi:hypothetical protein
MHQENRHRRVAQEINDARTAALSATLKRDANLAEPSRSRITSPASGSLAMVVTTSSLRLAHKLGGCAEIRTGFDDRMQYEKYARDTFKPREKGVIGHSQGSNKQAEAVFAFHNRMPPRSESHYLITNTCRE